MRRRINEIELTKYFYEVKDLLRIFRLSGMAFFERRRLSPFSDPIAAMKCIKIPGKRHGVYQREDVRKAIEAENELYEKEMDALLPGYRTKELLKKFHMSRSTFDRRRRNQARDSKGNIIDPIAAIGSYKDGPGYLYFAEDVKIAIEAEAIVKRLNDIHKRKCPPQLLEFRFKKRATKSAL